MDSMEKIRTQVGALASWARDQLPAMIEDNRGDHDRVIARFRDVQKMLAKELKELRDAVDGVAGFQTVDGPVDATLHVDGKPDRIVKAGESVYFEGDGSGRKALPAEKSHFLTGMQVLGPTMPLATHVEVNGIGLEVPGSHHEQAVRYLERLDDSRGSDRSTPPVIKVNGVEMVSVGCESPAIIDRSWPDYERNLKKYIDSHFEPPKIDPNFDLPETEGMPVWIWDAQTPGREAFEDFRGALLRHELRVPTGWSLVSTGQGSMLRNVFGLQMNAFNVLADAKAGLRGFRLIETTEA